MESLFGVGELEQQVEYGHVAVDDAGVEGQPALHRGHTCQVRELLQHGRTHLSDNYSSLSSGMSEKQID